MSEQNRISIKLVQLPIPEVHDLYTQGNIPLAAGYLKAAALKEHAAANEDISIIPREIANYGGDAAIVRWIIQEKPIAVGFSNYMWNIERNIAIAQELKRIDPEIKILFGGPEIHPGHWSLKNNHIDAFAIGEGEGVFIDFLMDLKNGKPLNRQYHRAKPVDLMHVPNPYLENILVPQPGESLFLESMRGCPYTCKYCFYSKSRGGLRFFPERQLEEMFSLARDYNVPEIYFMDPSFNVTPQLKEKLARVRELNSTCIPIHTEIRLEGVTPEIARAMKAAGFRSVEAGLQSVNEKALAAIDRTWNKEKFLRGARLLQEQGIDIKTGIILGLPYDTLDDLERTLDFVMELDLAESMEIYPLSLIPGTRLRDEAGEMGIETMPHPPYWVLSTRDMTRKELKYAIELLENKLEIEFFPPVIPHFRNQHPGYIHFLDIREKKEVRRRLDALYREPWQLGHSLTVLTGEACDIESLVELGQWLRRVSPFTLVQLVFDTDVPPPAKELRRLADSFFYAPHYFNHIHHYKADNQGKYSLRYFHLTGDLKIAESYLYQSKPCDLVLRFSGALLEKGREILEERPILLVESPIHEEQLKELNDLYRGFEPFLIVGNDTR